MSHDTKLALLIQQRAAETQAVVDQQTKEKIRRLHERARRAELAKRSSWLRHAINRFRDAFADGAEIHPSQIKPELVPVATSEDEELFRLARCFWSLPFTKGFGRRLRFLIWDESNRKLIGILGLQSPPIDLEARDQLFNYPPGEKTILINQTMDIYTLGALPPYSILLGGKLIAYLAASNEVRECYRIKYSSRPTIMQQRTLPPHLVALTTTSAFGRSSLYNRLRYDKELLAEPIGFTKGYGTVHISDIYDDIRRFAEGQGLPTHGGYGVGPKIRWQVLTRALYALGLPDRLLRHGVQRQVFLYRLVTNLEDYMAGRDREPRYKDLPAKDLIAFWRSRWLLPRATRVNHWPHWSKEEALTELLRTCENNS